VRSPDTIMLDVLHSIDPIGISAKPDGWEYRLAYHNRKYDSSENPARKSEFVVKSINRKIVFVMTDPKHLDDITQNAI
jgi:hypothetical protein